MAVWSSKLQPVENQLKTTLAFLLCSLVRRPSGDYQMIGSENRKGIIDAHLSLNYRDQRVEHL